VQPRDAIAILDTYDDLVLPEDRPEGMNEPEWAAVAALPVARIEDAANATAGALLVHLAAARAHDPDAPRLGDLLDHLTRVVTVSEVTRAADRGCGRPVRDEQQRCVVKAQKELGKLPTVLTAKIWLAIQIEANA
jgi:hypothetical protein